MNQRGDSVTNTRLKTSRSTFAKFLPLLVALLFSLPASHQVKAGTFTPTGSLTTPREGHTATLLPNGKVLVAGGLDAWNDQYVASSELYDPSTGTWTATGNMGNNRFAHTATLLPNGQVLVVGGYTYTCELYDPSTGTWTPTGNLATGRGYHTAALLPNGKVLVAGGENTTGTAYISSAELYDPSTGVWTQIANMNTNRAQPTATLLANGKVLVAGGYVNTSGSTSMFTPTAELYDPSTVTWTFTGSMNVGRSFHRENLLPDGKVLVTGGHKNGGGAQATAELYDPASGTWASIAPLAVARGGHTATSLPNGRVLIVGSIDTNSPLNNELFLSTTTNWTKELPLINRRVGHSATLLPNGKVLIAGGIANDGNHSLDSAELYDPVSPILMSSPTRLPNGSIQLSFTNTPGESFTVLTSTDPTLSTSNWSNLGTTTETSPGQFQFTDSQATTNSQLYYRISSP